ncbi:HAD family hydrolase [Nocardia crassostreae]|uniref:HAD family hydrolase n=1 Tax=Nocardia crassostreae TaxID=53428 RepID=UPI000832CD03|nr:HAD family hydrolase [Nocardia crassostreae]
MIYSRNAFDATPELSTVCVEHLEGAPLSFMTIIAADRMRTLTEPAAVIPTTTRTIKQFNRIRLPGAPWRYAITTNGGNILENGVPDMRWRIDLDAEVRATSATLSEVNAELRSRIDDSFVTKFRVADHLFCYLVVKPKHLPDGFLAEWDAWCRPRGWSASQQGRKIYTMPLAVCKSRAVAEVRRRLTDSGELSPEARLLAAGDGALDAEMLRAADSAIRPRHGELEHLAWTHPNLTITRATGILAGEEIINWFIKSAPPQD